MLEMVGLHSVKIWYGMVWFGIVSYRMSILCHCAVWYNTARNGMALACHSMVCHGMVCYGMVWYGTVWYGMV